MDQLDPLLGAELVLSFRVKREIGIMTIKGVIPYFPGTKTVA